MSSADASLALWHMRLAEGLTVISVSYIIQILFKIIQKLSADRFAEMWVIVWRITTGLEGKKPDQLPNLGLKRLAIAIGESLSVNQR
ncbi:MAG: hypothetical protein MH252_00795 [Thermosynechococcaceae cyanobacterium MS004]|nr:hypothetical protein [Thermosynechococcaceae cyanobacterium MS004]